jgi:hypothetical protein
MTTYTLTNKENNTEIIKGAKKVETEDKFEEIDGNFSTDNTEYTTEEVVPADSNDENSVEKTVKKVWIVEEEKEPPVESSGGRKRRSSKKYKKGGNKQTMSMGGRKSKKCKKGGKRPKKTRRH